MCAAGMIGRPSESQRLGHSAQAQRWEKPADKVPMPCVSAKSGSRAFQRLETEPFGRKPDLTPIGEEPFAVGRNEVCHRVTLPPMAVQPESTVHGENHPVDATAELAERQCRFSG